MIVIAELFSEHKSKIYNYLMYCPLYHVLISRKKS